MIAKSQGRAVGVLGCVDAPGALRPALAGWAAETGGRQLFQTGPLVLFGWGGLEQVRWLRGGDAQGLLLGELYQTEPPLSASSGPFSDEQLSALLVDGYLRLGEAFVTGLNGQLAFILWEPARRSLLLYRDGSGSKTIYYQEQAKGVLVFSDSLDLLIGSPVVEKRVSVRGLHEYLRFLDISTPNTIYEGVYATEPEDVCRHDGTELRRCARAAGPGISVQPDWSLGDAAAALGSVLEQSVAQRMASGAVTVSLLSGGVDSALVTTIAAALDPNKVEALTVGFDETGFDESAVARRIASHVGVRHHVLSFAMSDYLRAFDTLTAEAEIPFGDPAGIPTWLAFKYAREIADIALDGTGADTLVGVMPARHQRLAVAYGALLPPWLRRPVVGAMKWLPVLRDYTPLLDFFEPEEVLIRWRGWSKQQIEELCGGQVDLEHTRYYKIFRMFARHRHLERYSALMGNLPDDRIHQAARLQQLTVRFPYFDPAVVACVRQMAPELRYCPHEPKRVLKAVLADRLPRALWDVPKHGFDFPFVAFMEADKCAMVREYLAPELMNRWGFFDQRLVTHTVNAFISGDRSVSFRVWALVLLLAWLERHFQSL